MAYHGSRSTPANESPNATDKHGYLGGLWEPGMELKLRGGPADDTTSENERRAMSRFESEYRDRAEEATPRNVQTSRPEVAPSAYQGQTDPITTADSGGIPSQPPTKAATPSLQMSKTPFSDVSAERYHVHYRTTPRQRWQEITVRDMAVADFLRHVCSDRKRMDVRMLRGGPRTGVSCGVFNREVRLGRLHADAEGDLWLDVLEEGKSA